MKVIIIYNPNSTGNGKANASRLAKELRSKGVDATIRGTLRAGHGGVIAESYGKRKEEIVLISSSGDGGYHDVVNGALKHASPKLIVGVLPSGNANDHFNATTSGALIESIKNRTFQKIDTIKVTATVGGKPWVRYAHSYVGMGVTATAAKRLTRDRPNILTEKWIVFNALFSFRSVRLEENGHRHRYSSIIFGNINRMSKVMQLSDKSSITDGKFEMSSIRFGSKLRLLIYLATAATVGLKSAQSLSRYTCTALRPLLIQLDGEVYTIDEGSTIQIQSIKQNLRCVL